MGRLAHGPDGWIGVDFDRCLSYREDDGDTIDPGPPVPAMVARVKQWLLDGKNVRIFTARVAAPGDPKWGTVEDQIAVINAWCVEHLHAILPITCSKDSFMLELWDDSCVAVEENTGRQLSPSKVEGAPGTLTSEPTSEKLFASTREERRSGHSGYSQGPTQ